MLRFCLMLFISVGLFSCSSNEHEEFKGIKFDKWNEELIDNFLLKQDSIFESSNTKATNQIESYDTLLLISKSNGLKLAEQNIYRRYAFLYSDLGSLNQATDYLNKSIFISIQLNDSFAYWSSFANLGLVYSRFKMNEKAAQYIEASVNYFKSNKHWYSYSQWMYNLAGVYNENKQLDKAINGAREALVFNQKISKEYQNLKKDSLLLAIQYLEFLNKKNKDSALFLSKQIEPWIVNETNSILKSYAYGLSSLIYQNVDVAKSNLLMDSCRYYFKSEASINDKLSQYQILSEYYLNAKKLDSALKYNLLKQSLNDTFYSSEKLKILTNSERMYSMLVNKDILLLKKEKENQKNTGIFLLILFLVLVFVIYLAHLNEKSKKEKLLSDRNIKINKLMEEVNQTKMEAWADGQEKERTRIASELHDRLGGLLVMAGQHFNQFEKKFEELKKENNESFSEFKKIINTAIIEVRELSKDISSNLVSKLGLANALLDIKNKVESATGIDIELKIFNAESRLQLSAEIALFRVVQESINNIVKHANASKINISLTGNEDSVVLMIEDNGKGFQINQFNSDIGLGIKSMKKRINDIGGIFNIDSQLERGTIVIVEISI